MRPITPSEAHTLKQGAIPDSIIKAVNSLLIKKYSKDKIVLKQDDIIAEILRTSNLTKEEILDNKWLDFEELYRSAGWVVSYEKSNYNDDGPSLFMFKSK